MHTYFYIYICIYLYIHICLYIDINISTTNIRIKCRGAHKQQRAFKMTQERCQNFSKVSSTMCWSNKISSILIFENGYLRHWAGRGQNITKVSFGLFSYMKCIGEVNFENFSRDTPSSSFLHLRPWVARGWKILKGDPFMKFTVWNGASACFLRIFIFFVEQDTGEHIYIHMYISIYIWICI